MNLFKFKTYQFLILIVMWLNSCNYRKSLSESCSILFNSLDKQYYFVFRDEGIISLGKHIKFVYNNDYIAIKKLDVLASKRLILIDIKQFTQFYGNSKNDMGINYFENLNTFEKRILSLRFANKWIEKNGNQNTKKLFTY